LLYEQKEAFYIGFIKARNSNIASLKKDRGYSNFSQSVSCNFIINKGFDTREISEILDVKILTVYNWFNRWEKEGIEGLKTKSGQGRKPLLSIDNKSHVKAVKKAVKKRAQTGENILLSIEEDLGLQGQMTMDILRPFLKKLISYGNDFAEQ
jgi:transposase